ncbi:MAG TPA: xanthine dehydrogenase family protein subunit M, partial [Roseiflexaceae bacterium]|nr:xanthine dehydrogenase family protein subunit M [Roseiflexaceae bacterium]
GKEGPPLKAAAFAYAKPASLAEAFELLQKPNAKVLAGGQSLIPAMRFRLASPTMLIDINKLTQLESLHEDNGHLVIGGLTREVMLEESDAVAKSFALLADAARVIADPLVRNRATVGGNLAHADPANDHPAVMLAYNAEVVARSAKGTRTIPIDDFFVGIFESSLQPDELLTEIRVPRPGANSGGAYVKVERKVGDYAIAAVAVQLTVENGNCTAARIALTNVNSVPMRATGAEAALIGQSPNADVLEAAGQAAAAECDPSGDLRGSVEYKRNLVRILTKRAIAKAAERAGVTR